MKIRGLSVILIILVLTTGFFPVFAEEHLEAPNLPGDARLVDYTDINPDGFNYTNTGGDTSALFFEETTVVLTTMSNSTLWVTSSGEGIYSLNLSDPAPMNIEMEIMDEDEISETLDEVEASINLNSTSSFTAEIGYYLEMDDDEASMWMFWNGTAWEELETTINDLDYVSATVSESGSYALTEIDDKEDEEFGPEDEDDDFIPRREGNKFTVETDKITLNFEGINGDVPKFTYYATNENETMYRVFFHQLFEYSDDDGDGVFNESKGDRKITNFALPSGELNLEGPLNIRDENNNSIGAQFNYTITNGRSPVSDDVRLFLECKIYKVNSSEANVTARNELKIDVIVDEWEFENPDNMLALWWSFTSSNDTPEAEVGDNNVILDEGYFSWVENATIYYDDGNESVPVYSDVSQSESVMNVYLSYPSFEERLVHDPTIGVLTAQTEEPDGGWIPAFPSSAILLGFMVTLFVLATRKHTGPSV